VCPLIRPIHVARMPTPLHPPYVILSSMLSSRPSPILPTFSPKKSKIQFSYCKFVCGKFNNYGVFFFFLHFWDIKNFTKFLIFFCQVSEFTIGKNIFQLFLNFIVEKTTTTKIIGKKQGLLRSRLSNHHFAWVTMQFVIIPNESC